MNQTWICCEKPESKRQSMEWKHPLVKKKFNTKWSVKKVMLTVFLDMKGPITIDFLEKGATVNSASYCQFLKQYFTLFLEWTSLVYLKRYNSVHKKFTGSHHHISSSCRAISMDIPDPRSPPLPIVHCFHQVFRATSRIGTAAVYRFKVVVLPLLVHVKGSTGVHHLWACPYFSSSVLHVWFV